MNILVLGGTRFFGVHLVKELIEKGHTVTIATRGIQKDPFEDDKITRVKIDRYDINSMKSAFFDKKYDVVYDNLAYCSNDVKTALNSIHCKTYILISSTAVYPEGSDLKEFAFQPDRYRIQMGNRSEFSYAEGKRQAEAVLSQVYDGQKSVIVRFPVILGEDDYTKRLFYYVEHIMQNKPMDIDHSDKALSFLSAHDAGRFLAIFSNNKREGFFHISAKGTITVNEILRYIEEKTGKKAKVHSCKDKAPYNDMPEQSLYLGRINQMKFKAAPLDSWIYSLLDTYIAQCK